MQISTCFFPEKGNPYHTITHLSLNHIFGREQYLPRRNRKADFQNTAQAAVEDASGRTVRELSVMFTKMGEC
jgi:hypothetical protein